jgi:hypothetical protein
MNADNGNKRTTTTTADSVVKYADGSMYVGQLARDGQRTGTGTCRYPFTLYGEVTGNPTTLFHWMEYSGEWENDEPTTGELVCIRGDGRREVQFNGLWKYGSPQEDDLSERFAQGQGAY